MPIDLLPWGNIINFLRLGLNIHTIFIITGLTAIESGLIRKKSDIRTGKTGG